MTFVTDELSLSRPRSIIKKVPDLIENFVERAAQLVKAADGAVQLTGVSLMLQVLPGVAVSSDCWRASRHSSRCFLV